MSRAAYFIPLLDEGKCTLSMPNTIQKVEEITWETWERVGTQSVGPAPMNTTPVTLYFIFSDPVQAMKKEVWWGFLEIACRGAEGEKYFSTARNKILGATWNWFGTNGGGIIKNYNGGINHISRNVGNITFKYSDLKRDIHANCQDASALFQVCCNAVGVGMRVRYCEWQSGGVPSPTGVNVDGIALCYPLTFGQSSKPERWMNFETHMVGTWPGDNPKTINSDDKLYEATVKRADISNPVSTPILPPQYSFFPQEGLSYIQYIIRFCRVNPNPNIPINNTTNPDPQLQVKWYKKAEIKSVW